MCIYHNFLKRKGDCASSFMCIISGELQLGLLWNSKRTMIEEFSEASAALEERNGHIIPLNYLEVLRDKYYKTPDFSETDINEIKTIYLFIHLFNKS